MMRRVCTVNPTLRVSLSPPVEAVEAPEPALSPRLINPAIQGIGAQASAAPAVYESWRAGRIVETPSQTFAEGPATGVGFTMIQRRLADWLHDFLLVEEQEILPAMVWMTEYTHSLAEGSDVSPLAIAYQLREPLQDKKVGLVCSGGDSSLAHLERVFADTRSDK